MLPVDAEEPLAFEARPGVTPLTDAPRLSHARVPLLQRIEVTDERGTRRTIDIPAERPLTLYVDRQELVTLMTLGAAPELLALGYLLNQGLIDSAGEVDGIDVDWEVASAAVKTRAGVANFAERTARRVVTTGCGQGTVFGDAMARIDAQRFDPADGTRLRQGDLARILDLMRMRHSVHRQAGSVHGCALFGGSDMLVFAEDVGRHNAIDTVAGWMAVHGVRGGDKCFYTTGRLTSEMVMKAARMGVPIVVSRNGVTAMGHELAVRLGLTLFGRAANRRFLCYCGAERLVPDPEAMPGGAGPVETAVQTLR